MPILCPGRHGSLPTILFASLATPCSPYSDRSCRVCRYIMNVDATDMPKLLWYLDRRTCTGMRPPGQVLVAGNARKFNSVPNRPNRIRFVLEICEKGMRPQLRRSSDRIKIEVTQICEYFLNIIFS